MQKPVQKPMQKVSELMQQMGFKPDAPQATAEAFVRSLVKSAYGVDVQIVSDLPKSPLSQPQTSKNHTSSAVIRPPICETKSAKNLPNHLKQKISLKTNQTPQQLSFNFETDDRDSA